MRKNKILRSFALGVGVMLFVMLLCPSAAPATFADSANTETGSETGSGSNGSDGSSNNTSGSNGSDNASGSAAATLNLDTDVSSSIGFMLLGVNLNSATESTNSDTTTLDLAGRDASSDHGAYSVNLDLCPNQTATAAISVVGATTGAAGLIVAATAPDGTADMTSLVSQKDSSAKILATPAGNPNLTPTTTGTPAVYWGIRKSGIIAYTGLPAYDSASAFEVLSSGASGTVTQGFEIGVRTTDTTIAGTYVGGILFTAVANYYEPAGTFDDAFAAMTSSTFYDGLDSASPLAARSQKYTITTSVDSTTGESTTTVARATAADLAEGSGVTTYYAMQAMSADICNYVETPSASGTHLETQLVDLRDGNLYYITKAATGTCWMTQNLDLDLTTSGLDSRLSDIGYLAYTPAATDASSPEDNDTITYWNASYTRADSISPRVPLATEDYDPDVSLGTTATSWTTRSLDYGKKYLASGCGATSVDDCWETNSSYPSKLTTTAPSVGGEHYSIGNYYQANAVYADTTRRTNPNDGTSYNATNSICPAGWRLPATASTTTDEDDVAALAKTYGYNYASESYDSTGKSILSAPFYFVRAGYVVLSTTETNQLKNITARSYYLTSTLHNTSNSPYVVKIQRTGFQTGSTLASYHYVSVRCVAR